MNHESQPTFHETVQQDIAEVDANLRHPFIPDAVSKTQTADIGDRRLTVRVSKSQNGYSKNATDVVAADNPIDRLADIPETFVPGADVDLGIRHDKASLFHEKGHDGDSLSHASVKTASGRYTARESGFGETVTRVERPGYGIVEIKNPEARQRVASLAGKAIKQTLSETSAVKGKEVVEDRDWFKKAQRTTRRLTGKKSVRS